MVNIGILQIIIIQFLIVIHNWRLSVGFELWSQKKQNGKTY